MDRQAFQERFGILGQSPALLRTLERVRHVAPADITVLLEGESGVGKELLASALHGLSARRHRRLVVVNCGAIPEGLIESELFGAEKGAYTGAVERRAGYFEEADGGTILLDEIGEMPLGAQVRLLRVLETGQFSRVGSSQPQQADVRVVAATNKDLGREVQAGAFREDLYYRLSAIVVRVPPLRERTGDVVPLFEAFLRRFSAQYKAPVPRLAGDARDLLARYNWPGNVRELRNVAEQTVVLLREDPVTAAPLRPFLRGITAGGGLAVAPKPGPGAADGRERELIFRALLEIRAELAEVRALLRGARPAPLPPPAAWPAAWPAPAAPPSFAEGTPAPSAPHYRDVGADHEVAYEPPEDDAPAPEASDVPYEIEWDAPETRAGARADDEADRSGLDRSGLDRPGLGAGPLGDGAPEGLAGLLARGLPLPTIEDAELLLIREALRRFEGNRRQSADALGISERTLYRKLRDLDDAP